ncbi:MAG: hypothetical protein AAGH48_08850, partial [Pseudomonadota bacterium]
ENEFVLVTPRRYEGSSAAGRFQFELKFLGQVSGEWQVIEWDSQSFRGENAQHEAEAFIADLDRYAIDYIDVSYRRPVIGGNELEYRAQVRLFRSRANEVQSNQTPPNTSQ